MLLGHRCVGAVEIDPYCRRVLEARQRDGILKPFPIHDDIRTFDGTAWRGRVDIVCGGFPCQPWSSAGKRLGKLDERHLWPEMARVVAEVRPRFVFAENVSLAAFEEPWRDLRRLGYRVPPALRLGGCQMGAMYHRHRWWLLAADVDGDGRTLVEQEFVGGSNPTAAVDRDASDSHRERCGTTAPRQEQSERHEVDDGVVVADAGGVGLQGRDVSAGPRDEGARARRASGRGSEAGTPAFGTTWRAAAPRLRRLVSGAARGMDSRRKRIHAVGNAQVPICAATAFKELMRRLAEVS